MTMKIKKSQWLYLIMGIFFLFVAVLYRDIHKNITVIFQKKSAKAELINAIEKNKKILTDEIHSHPPSMVKMGDQLLNTSDVLDDLTHFFSQDMTVSKIRLLNVKTLSGVDVLPVKVSLTGQLMGFSKELMALFKDSRLMAINDFSLQVNPYGTMSAEIQLLIFSFR
jgi:Tfp pilus assembly protein PilO